MTQESIISTQQLLINTLMTPIEVLISQTHCNLGGRQAENHHLPGPHFLLWQLETGGGQYFLRMVQTVL